jgi:hypothetical protein
LCPDRELDDALETVGAGRLPLVDRLLAEAFALAREGSCGDWAVRMFHDALARDPYHPGGRYDLACTLTAQGWIRGVRVELLAAITDGTARLADRYAHDPDLAGLDISADDLARAVRGATHALETIQVRPVADCSGIWFPIRPDARA